MWQLRGIGFGPVSRPAVTGSTQGSLRLCPASAMSPALFPGDRMRGRPGWLLAQIGLVTSQGKSGDVRHVAARRASPASAGTPALARRPGSTSAAQRREARQPHALSELLSTVGSAVRWGGDPARNGGLHPCPRRVTRGDSLFCGSGRGGAQGPHGRGAGH